MVLDEVREKVHAIEEQVVHTSRQTNVEVDKILNRTNEMIRYTKASIKHITNKISKIVKINEGNKGILEVIVDVTFG